MPTPACRQAVWRDAASVLLPQLLLPLLLGCQPVGAVSGAVQLIKPGQETPGSATFQTEAALEGTQPPQGPPLFRCYVEPGYPEPIYICVPNGTVGISNASCQAGCCIPIPTPPTPSPSPNSKEVFKLDDETGAIAGLVGLIFVVVAGIRFFRPCKQSAPGHAPLGDEEGDGTDLIAPAGGDVDNTGARANIYE